MKTFIKFINLIKLLKRILIIIKFNLFKTKKMHCKKFIALLIFFIVSVHNFSMKN